MSKTELALVAFNVFSLLAVVGGLAAGHPDPMGAALAISLLALLANSAYVLRRSGRAAPAASRELTRTKALADEMDARTLLDIDARLEALERRERDVDEAERLRLLLARDEPPTPAERVRLLVAEGDPISPSELGGGTGRKRVR